MSDVTSTRGTEEALLSCVVLDPDAIAQLDAIGLRPEHFSDSRLSYLFAEALGLHRDGIEANPVTLATRIEERGNLAETLGPDWLTYLCDLGRFGATSQPEYVARSLIEQHDRRRLQAKILELSGLAADATIDNVELLALARELLDDTSKSSKRSILRAVDLIESNPKMKPVLIDGLLRRGEVCNLISKSKIGKSWTVYGLFFHVAMGWRWLGQFQCAPGRVLLCDNELHPETLAFRLKTVAEALGLLPSDYADRIDVMTLRGDLRSIMDRQALFSTIKPGDYSLIVLDALYRAVPSGGAGENDNAAMTAIYNALDAYCRDFDTSFLIVHHASKGDQSGKDVTDVGAGAGAQSRACDAHLVMRPHEEENCVVVDAAVRSFPPPEPLALRWEFPLWRPADDLDPKALKRPETRQDERQAAKDQEGFAAIVAALRTHGSGTARQIRAWTGFGADRANRLIASMSRDGRLNSTPSTYRGTACELYELADHLRPVMGSGPQVVCQQNRPVDHTGF